MRQKYRLQSAVSCPWQYIAIISVPSDMPFMPFIVFHVIYNKMLNKNRTLYSLFRLDLMRRWTYNKKNFQTIEGIRLSQLGKTDDCSTLACAATSSPVELALVPSALRAFSMDRAA